jgi:hypothetical protein
MMSLVQVPGAPGTMVSIMGLFPPFIGKDAGLWFHTRSEKSWSSRKVLSLPFAHRCEFLPGSEEPVLLAATVSRHKENPADWSKPGELYAVKAGMPDQETWPCEKLDISLTRNHGMFRGMIDGEQSLCISGKEGILRICQDPDGSWQFETLFDQEVSEFSFLDLDGDGRSELVSIEPFHGSSLNIYKRRNGVWIRRFAAELSFGHGLSSGIIMGKPLIVAGNRDQDLSLQIFTVDDLSQNHVRKVFTEEGAGPTQTQVIGENGRDFVLSANQKQGEVALYFPDKNY